MEPPGLGSNAPSAVELHCRHSCGPQSPRQENGFGNTAGTGGLRGRQVVFTHGEGRKARGSWTWGRVNEGGAALAIPLHPPQPTTAALPLFSLRSPALMASPSARQRGPPPPPHVAPISGAVGCEHLRPGQSPHQTGSSARKVQSLPLAPTLAQGSKWGRECPLHRSPPAPHPPVHVLQPLPQAPPRLAASSHSPSTDPGQGAPRLSGVKAAGEPVTSGAGVCGVAFEAIPQIPRLLTQGEI